ncbi:MAG: aminoglycoside phosphotransferase family protein [Bryobacteraceae bacterium]
MKAVCELTEHNAPIYLRERHRIEARKVSVLQGGVSNVVLLVESDACRFVLKQSLPQLRTAAEWFCDRRRIFQESAALKMLAGRLPQGSVPVVLFEDPDNFLFAMSAADAGSETWKEQLLRGDCDTAVATQLGRIQSALIGCSGEARESFGSQEVFSQLRLEPYYKVTALRHPDLAPRLNALADSYGERRLALVHGDWSPKNFLVSPQGQAMAIDFEVIHFGDPAFDVAFLLNHLLLKSFYRPEDQSRYASLAQAYWQALPQIEGLEESAIRHLGALLLARMDGKSPVEYIQDDRTKDEIRSRARGIILHPPKRIREVFQA